LLLGGTVTAAQFAQLWLVSGVITFAFLTYTIQQLRKPKIVYGV
jgi:hypothetical protein